MPFLVAKTCGVVRICPDLSGFVAGGVFFFWRDVPSPISLDKGPIPTQPYFKPQVALWPKEGKGLGPRLHLEYLGTGTESKVPEWLTPNGPKGLECVVPQHLQCLLGKHPPG